MVEAVGTEEKADQIVAEITQLELMTAQNATADQLRQQEQKIENLLQRAGGVAAQRIAEARSYRWQVENEGRGRLDRFLAQLAGFKAQPQVFEERMRLTALAQGMGNSRKLIMATDPKDTILRFDFKDQFSAFDQLDPTNPQNR